MAKIGIPQNPEDLLNVENLAEGVGGLTLLSELGKTIKSIVSNPLAAVPAFEILGRSINNNVIENLKKTKVLTEANIAQFNKLTESSALFGSKTARNFSIAASSIGSFSIKLGMLRDQLRQLSGESTQYGQLSFMPGGTQTNAPFQQAKRNMELFYDTQATMGKASAETTQEAYQKLYTFISQMGRQQNIGFTAGVLTNPEKLENFRQSFSKLLGGLSQVRGANIIGAFNEMEQNIAPYTNISGGGIVRYIENINKAFQKGELPMGTYAENLQGILGTASALVQTRGGSGLSQAFNLYRTFSQSNVPAEAVSKFQQLLSPYFYQGTGTSLQATGGLIGLARVFGAPEMKLASGKTLGISELNKLINSGQGLLGSKYTPTDVIEFIQRMLQKTGATSYAGISNPTQKIALEQLSSQTGITPGAATLLLQNKLNFQKHFKDVADTINDLNKNGVMYIQDLDKNTQNQLSHMTTLSDQVEGRLKEFQTSIAAHVPRVVSYGIGGVLGLGLGAYYLYRGQYLKALAAGMGGQALMSEGQPSTLLNSKGVPFSAPGGIANVVTKVAEQAITAKLLGKTIAKEIGKVLTTQGTTVATEATEVGGGLGGTLLTAGGIASGIGAGIVTTILASMVYDQLKSAATGGPNTPPEIADFKKQFGYTPATPGPVSDYNPWKGTPEAMRKFASNVVGFPFKEFSKFWNNSFYNPPDWSPDKGMIHLGGPTSYAPAPSGVTPDKSKSDNNPAINSQSTVVNAPVVYLNGNLVDQISGTAANQAGQAQIRGQASYSEAPSTR